MRKLHKVLPFAFAILFVPLFVGAVSIGEEERFFIESSYDRQERESITASLRVVTDDIQFYIESDWWEDLSENEREGREKILYNLGKKFKEEIHPEVSESYGDIPDNEITGEDHIVVLFHSMKRDAGGYFRTGDQYSRFQYSRSNEGNILYLNADFMNDPNISGYLAHEYIHLITFNEKNREHGVSEEVWLNELRAEMIISLLGYNDDYEGSNLEMRVRNFLRDPDFSLTEWTEQAADYGIVNLFGHYLVEQHGEEILYDSLRSRLVGIPSISYALDKNDEERTFSEVFTDWTIAVYLNDCSYGEEYCYKNEHLKDVNVSPSTVFVPSGRNEEIRVEYKTKNWAGNWQKIIGGEGTFHLNFKSRSGFVVPYVICKEDGDCEIEFMELNEEGGGKLKIEDFSSRYESITLIPSLQEKSEGFNGPERSFAFKWEAWIEKELSPEERQKIRDKLSELRERLESLIKTLKEIKRGSGNVFKRDLHYGMTDSKDVERLQDFLKRKEGNIYPEGFVTGNFYDLTKEAVIRFQEKYKEDILVPHGLKRGTGYVGELTRRKLNELIEK